MIEEKNIFYWRRQAHNNFDPIWRNNWLTRDEAYCWLANQLDCVGSQAHIANLSEQGCHKVIKLSRDFLANPLIAVNRWNKKRDKDKRRIDRERTKIRTRRRG